MLDQKLMHSILKIAEEMISAGAEVYRIEESLKYMCSAYGAVRTDAFVTTSYMTLDIEREDGVSLTASRRFETCSFDVERIARLNDLVRYITKVKPSAEEIDERLKTALIHKQYTIWQRILFSVIVASSFTVFFGCRDIVEILASSVIGFITAILSCIADRIKLNGMMTRFVCSAAFSAMAFLSVKLGLAPNPDYIIIGNIMTLIPGCGITNALRDLFTGDTFTGILRTIEAVLYAGAMALGYIAMAYLFGGAI